MLCIKCSDFLVQSLYSFVHALYSLLEMREILMSRGPSSRHSVWFLQQNTCFNLYDPSPVEVADEDCQRLKRFPHSVLMSY